MKVYLLGTEHGEYSDYSAEVLGIYSTREKAEEVIEQVKQWREDSKAYDEMKWTALKEQGYGRLSWSARQTVHAAWTAENPAPKLMLPGVWPRLADEDDGERRYFPWDASLEVVEVEVR